MIRYIGPTPNVPPRKFFCIPIYTVSVVSDVYLQTILRHFQAYPESTGFSHITSGLDPYAKLDYDPQYLS